MTEKSIVYEKSKKFALRIVRLCKYLEDEKQEFVIAKQLLRCGTSIGANLAESICAVSRADFLNKNSIAYKESSETRYWLELLNDAGYISDQQFASIYQGADELFRMLTSIVKTTKDHPQNSTRTA